MDGPLVSRYLYLALLALMLLAGDFELVNPLPPVFGDVDVVLRIRRDPMRLIELTWEASRAAEA